MTTERERRAREVCPALYHKGDANRGSWDCRCLAILAFSDAERAEAEDAAYVDAYKKSLVKVEEAKLAEREAVLDAAVAIATDQPYYPDTNVGMRQQWVKDQIVAKLTDLRGGRT